MKYAFMGLGMIAAGLAGVLFIGMFQSITVNNETEYYVLKEAMEASMIESIDFGCYGVAVDQGGCGETIKISEQKFVENFTRRFVENISGDASSYELEFYDIIESPPKASVIVKGITQNYTIVAGEGEDGTFSLKNGLNGILVYDPLVRDSLLPEEIIEDTPIPDSDLDDVEITVSSDEYDETDEAGIVTDAYGNILGVEDIYGCGDTACDSNQTKDENGNDITETADYDKDEADASQYEIIPDCEESGTTCDDTTSDQTDDST